MLLESSNAEGKEKTNGNNIRVYHTDGSRNKRKNPVNWENSNPKCWTCGANKIVIEYIFTFISGVDRNIEGKTVLRNESQIATGKISSECRIIYNTQ